MSEKVLDEENWKLEALAVINDVKDHVKSATVADKLQNTDQRVYLNLTTLEDEPCCVELTGRGFRLVGKSYDTLNIDNGEYFETPYALLSKISVNFYKSFGNALMTKLNTLNTD